MVRFEASEALPFPAREAVYDYCRQTGPEEGYSRVLLVGVARGKLQEFLDRVAERGLTPGRAAPSSTALQAVAEALPAVRERAVVLADVSGASVETVALLDGDLVFSREAPLPESGTEEERRESIVRVVLTSVHMAMERLHSESTPTALVHCPPDAGAAVSAAIKEELGHEVRLLDPRELQEALGCRFGDGEGSEVSLRTVGLALIALRNAQPEINLLPEEVRNGLQVRSKRLRWLRIAAGGLVCALLLFSAAKAAMARTERRISMLDNEIRRMSPVAREVEAKRTELKLIREQLGGGFSPYALIMEIYRLTPSGVTLSQVSIDGRGGVTVHGQGRALSQAFDYLAVLEDCDLIDRAEARYAEKRPVGDKEIVDFEIFLTLRARGERP
jgi:hypothetical protein